MSITLKRWEPETDFSRIVIREAAEETREKDQKELASKQTDNGKSNQLIDVRT